PLPPASGESPPRSGCLPLPLSEHAYLSPLITTSASLWAWALSGLTHSSNDRRPIRHGLTPGLHGPTLGVPRLEPLRSSRMTAAPMSRASGRGGGCVLRASGRPVHLDRYPFWGSPRLDQLKRCVRAGVGEQPRALADDHGADEQGDLVDKLVVWQPADQSAAAVHLQLTLPLGFQLADGARDVTGEDGCVRPPRFGERGRCDVLRLRVQGRCDGVGAQIYPCTCAPFHRAPGAGEDLVGPPPELERVGALVDLVERRRGLVVEQRRDPSAALESAAAVLVRPAESLHHSVDGDHRACRQFHGRSSFLAEYSRSLLFIASARRWEG